MPSLSMNHGVSVGLLVTVAALLGVSNALLMPSRLSETSSRNRIRPTSSSSFEFPLRHTPGLYAAFTDDSNAANIGDSSQEAMPENEEIVPERTLYEILRVNPLATRQEIKRAYFRLAKVSHPDALIDKQQQDGVDFQEVAEAWKILGNSKTRRRYDRELKAQEWSKKAQAYTNERLEQAVPVVADIMDNVAVPFLRKTTATTWAVGQAIATGFSKSREDLKQQASAPSVMEETVNGTPKADAHTNTNVTASDETVNGNTTVVETIPSGGQGPQTTYQPQATPVGLTNTFLSALEAGAKAAREIDSLELSQKSEQLEKRAREESKKGVEIAKELDEVKQQRLFATIQSPDVSLTASEAQEALERLPINDTVSIVDRAMLRHTLEEEIQALSDTEEQFTEKLEVYEEADREWNDLLVKEEAAKEDLSKKKNKEIEARKAFDDAHQKVVDAKKELVTTSNDLKGVEEQVRKNAQEMDRITSTLTKKQQRVRDALQKKTELMQGGIQIEYLSEEDLTALRKREIQLMGESKQIAEMVARLESRAEKLKVRAEQLRNWQTEWQNADKGEKVE